MSLMIACRKGLRVGRPFCMEHAFAALGRFNVVR